MAQWWEHSPPTYVARVRFPVSVSYVGWVCCWFSSLLRGFFSGHSGFPPSTKTNNSKFQFDLETVERRATPWIPLKFLFIYLFIYLVLMHILYFHIPPFFYVVHQAGFQMEFHFTLWWVSDSKKWQMHDNTARILEQTSPLSARPKKTTLLLICSRGRVKVGHGWVSGEIPVIWNSTGLMDQN